MTAARIGVLASHGGSILQAVMDAGAAGALDAKVVLVISNNSGSLALRRAAAAGIDSLHLSSRSHPGPGELDLAIRTALERAQVQWVLLAGYMKKLGPQTLNAFHRRILNVHPALLPRHGGRGFYGRRVHQAVVDAGDAETGATVHFVDEHYDNGPVIAQSHVSVAPGDSVEAVEQRVRAVERDLVVRTLAELVAGGALSSPSP